jgi:uroporphyrinogen decarboxylase
MINDLFLNALHCQNQSRPPVWLMRQAGRYMPEYRALRTQHSLWDLFHQPELAVEVTLMPINLLGVDAAILFSDILVIAEALGRNIAYVENKGPVIDRAIQTKADVDGLQVHSAKSTLGYVETAIHMLKKELRVPLIGFCGGPFTVASYMIEPGGKEDLKKTKQWLYIDPESFHQLLEKITQASIDYLLMQIQAGAQAVQIFDSWANVLPYAQYLEFSTRYLEKMVHAISPFAPVILFSRGSSLFPKELSALNPAAISFDWQQSMTTLRAQVPSHIAIQGNLDPLVMQASQEVVLKETQALLKAMHKEPGFIFNLGHGILPGTPVENVKFLVDIVKNSF